MMGDAAVPDAGMKGATTAADLSKTAEGAVHPVAVRRISQKKNVDYRAYRNAYIRQHAKAINATAIGELVRESQDTIEQYLPTLRIKALRFGVGSGRKSCVREYVEVAVLSKLSEDVDTHGSEALAQLLTSGKLGVALQDVLGEGKSLRGGGAAATDPHAVLDSNGKKVPDGPPVGSAANIQQAALPAEEPAKARAAQHTEFGAHRSGGERGEVGRLIVDPGTYDVRLHDQNLTRTAHADSLSQFFTLKTTASKPKRFKLLLC